MDSGRQQSCKSSWMSVEGARSAGRHYRDRLHGKWCMMNPGLLEVAVGALVGSPRLASLAYGHVVVDMLHEVQVEGEVQVVDGWDSSAG